MNRTEKNIKLNIVAIAVPALVCVLICSLILAGMTFSWFTDSFASSANFIKTASFTTSKSVMNVTSSEQVTPDANGKYTLSNGEYLVTIDASAATTKGYTMMYLGDTVFVQTCTIGNAVNIGTVTFNINVTAASAEISFADSWTEASASYPTIDSAGNCSILNVPTNGLTITETSIASALALANMPQTYSFGGVLMIIDPVYGYIYDLNGGIYYDPFNFENYYILDTESGYFVHVETGEMFNPVSANKIDSVTGYEIDSDTGYLIDPITGFLIHPVTNRLVYVQTETVIDGELTYEETSLIDVFTTYETDAETGYLVEPLTGRLMDAETMYYVIEGTDYLIIPATSYLYNSVTETYHDPLTYEEVTAEVALGIPTEESINGGEETEDAEEIDDPEIVDEPETPEDTSETEEQAPADDTQTDDTVVYSPVDGFINLPDTLEYQIVPYTVEDEVYGSCRMLYDTVSGIYLNLTANAVLYTDPLTGFYLIPGSAYQLIPATGYLYDTVYGSYLDPYTMLFATYDVALGITVDPTESEVTDVTDTTSDEPIVSETEPAVDGSETDGDGSPAEPTSEEPAVTTAPEAEPEVTDTSAEASA